MWSRGTRVCVPLWAAHATGVVTATAVLGTCADEAPRTCLCALTLTSIVLTIVLEGAERPPAPAPKFVYDPNATRAPSEVFGDAALEGAEEASELSSEASADSQQRAHATLTTMYSNAHCGVVPARPSTSPTPSTM